MDLMTFESMYSSHFEQDSRDEISLILKDQNQGEVGKLHATHQQDSALWKYPEQIELKTFTFPDPEAGQKLMENYRQFVSAYEKDSGTTRRFVQVDASNEVQMKFLEEDGWHPTQQIRAMNKQVQATLLHVLETYEYRQHTPYNIDNARSFDEVRELLQELHKLNASFNKKFTLAETGMSQLEAMFDETTSQNQGIWIVLKDTYDKPAGLVVLVGDNKKLEIEAFIIKEDLRTKKGSAKIEGQERPSQVLMKEGLQRAKQQLGFDQQTDLYLYVTEQNKIAQHFYDKYFGFELKTSIWDLGGEPG
jgi:ribosomal protein S18 acetylase RimI-like enzyme